MKSLKTGICGLGTVGSGTFNTLRLNLDEINARAGVSIEITQIGARRDNPDCDLTGFNITRDIFEVADNPDIDVLVELIGGTTVARELVLRAIANGKHVVTANKALIAEHGNEIFHAAEQQGVSVAYEAAVAAGVPVIKAMREGLTANRIEWLAGIINGTGNFILTEMRDKGRAFADVLLEAQALGYAEADPTFDVEGIDAAHKLTILASLAFGMPLQYEHAYTEGISKIETSDVLFARQLGYQIKHLGIARRNGDSVELRVHPTLIPEQQLLANVDGVLNAVLIKGNAVGPTLYCGAGAGAAATASAVIADIVDIARAIHVPPLGQMSETLKEITVLPMEDVTTGHYMRMSVLDKPGALSHITGIMGDLGIDIEAIIQKEPVAGQKVVPVVLLTDRVSEKLAFQAIERIEALDETDGKVAHIRVENLQ